MHPPNQQLIEKALAMRTRQIVVVLEDLYQPHNASSILKTCDAFGIQDLFIVNHRNRFQYDPIKSAGIASWIDRHEYFGEKATETCFTALKHAGYQIAATSLRPNSIAIDDLHVSGKLALCFGTEEKGLSDVAHTLADFFLRIPMYGLTQSFNVSVTVALSLQTLQRTNDQGAIARLNEQEKTALRRQWQAHQPSPS